MTTKTKAPLVFADCETDGVHPGRQAWEVAFIRREPDGSQRAIQLFVDAYDLSTADPFGLNVGGFYERHPYGQYLSGRRDERLPHMDPKTAGTGPSDYPVPVHGYVSESEAARLIARWTHGAHIVGANPAFDAATFEALLHRYRLTPAWHYHVVDVSAMALGWLQRDAEVLELRAAVEKPPADGPWLDLRAEAARLREAATPPYKSDVLTAALGLPPVPDDLRHTAMGDVQWAMAMYDQMTGATS